MSCNAILGLFSFLLLLSFILTIDNDCSCLQNSINIAFVFGSEGFNSLCQDATIKMMLPKIDAILTIKDTDNKEKILLFLFIIIICVILMDTTGIFPFT